MKYGIISAGNVGITFSYYLFKLNKDFLLYTRSVENKEKYFSHIPKVYFTDDFYHTVEKCDILFIATVDRLVEKTVNTILKINEKKKIVVFSGSFITEKKNVYNLHPAASIPVPILEEDFLTNIEFTAKQSSFIEKLKEDLGISVVYIKEYSPLYHVGAMMASNFVTILLFAAEKILKNFTKNEKETSLIIKSLTYTAFRSYFKQHKISGPIVRGDKDTIKKQKSAIKGKAEEIIYNAIINYGVNNFNAKK